MQRDLIIQQLKQINLNLDNYTIDAIVSFLINDVGFINQIPIQYQLYAATAYVSQTIKLPNIGHWGSSKNGINIQTVMSHLGQLSKQKFLDTINNQLEKLKNPPQNLKRKVQVIRYSYRFYKKYQTTFEELFNSFAIYKTFKQQFSALFWVTYLYIKNTHIQTQNITESKIFLILLFRMIFQKFLSNTEFQQTFDIMEQKIGAIPQIGVVKYNFYLELVQEKLSHFYSQRFSQKYVNFKKLSENFTFVERLVDDISNDYSKKQTELKFYNDLNQLSYLELKKNLTPQVFRKMPIIQTPQVITTKLLFEDDDDEDEDNQISQQETMNKTPQKVSILENSDGKPTIKINHSNETQSPISTPKWKMLSSSNTKVLFSQLQQGHPGAATPISIKQKNQAWMNKRIFSITPQMIGQFLQCLDMKQQKKIEQQNSQINDFKFIKQTIYQMIKEFSPKCRNYDQQYNKIMAFIISNYLQLKSQLKDKKFNIFGMIPLSCEVFNYINNSMSFCYKRHYEAFKIDLNVAFSALYLFKSVITKTMPYDLQDYIRKTKKRFFIDDIWQNGYGYKILTQTTNESQYSEIRLTITSQTQDRIKQICRQVRIQPKIITKTQNMIKFIFQNKPYLLKSNNIDQIILCCIMGCLSINQKEQHQTLSLLFTQYNSKIQFAYASNQSGLKDQFGNSMKIVDYYNEIFLVEIQNMLQQKKQELDDFLLTPVRITKRYSGSTINIEPAMKKQPLGGRFQLFNPQLKERGSNYRKSLIQQVFSMKQQKEEDQEDNNIPSPSFGRNFSFGPGTNN